MDGGTLTMAMLRITITREAGWADVDRLRLYVGTENAVDLASSTPAGGTQVQEVVIGQASPIRIEHRYRPTTPGKCVHLPIGVRVVDQAGNESDVLEQRVHVNDPPRGARGLTLAATGTPGEVQLSWTASPDVVAI